MIAQATRPGGKHLAAERGAVLYDAGERMQLPKPVKSMAPMIEFLDPTSLMAVAKIYEALPKAKLCAHA